MTTNTCIRAKTDENENIKRNIKIADEYVSSWCSITFISKISATFSARALAKLSCMKTENQNPGGYHTAWSEQVNKTNQCSDGARIIIHIWWRDTYERPSSLSSYDILRITNSAIFRHAPLSQEEAHAWDGGELYIQKSWVDSATAASPPREMWREEKRSRWPTSKIAPGCMRSRGPRPHPIRQNVRRLRMTR